MNDFNNQEFFDDSNLEKGSFTQDPQGYPVEFPVDSRREEYIRFNLIVSRTGGVLGFQKSQVVLISVVAAISLFMMVSDYVLYKRIDTANILLILFFAVSSAMLFYGLYYRIRNAAENTYDLTRQSGHSFYGIVTIYTDRIEKRNNTTSVTIRFSEASYIETHDMIIISAFQKPHIVLTARCLTMEDAEAVRQAVFGAVPVTRQKIVGRFQPLAQVHISPPENEAEGLQVHSENVISVDVNYTKEEFMKMSTDSAFRNYLKFLPFYSILSLISSLMIALLVDFVVGIFCYIVFNAGLIAFNLLSAKSRSARMYEALPRSQFTACFAEEGIVLKSPEGETIVKLGWDSILRAIERQDCLDFYSKALFIRIPKRCVDDLDSLKGFVDRHYTKYKKSTK